MFPLSLSEIGLGTVILNASLWDVSYKQSKLMSLAWHSECVLQVSPSRPKPGFTLERTCSNGGLWVFQVLSADLPAPGPAGAPGQAVQLAAGAEAPLAVRSTTPVWTLVPGGGEGCERATSRSCW